MNEHLNLIPWPVANPTVTSYNTTVKKIYNASVIKIYNAANSIALF
jgi:hypothetical protein